MSEGLDPILQQKEQQQLKTQLLWRLGIAGGLIAAILFGIAWIEKSQENTEPNVQIPQIAPELNASEPAEIASAASEAAISTPTPTSVPTPEATALPSISPKPSATALPAPSPNTEQTHSNQAQNQIQKIENLPKQIPRTSNRPQPTAVVAFTAIPLSNKIPTTAMPRLVTQPTSTIIATKPITAVFPSPINSTRGYSVQAGVFLHANNAEKLLNQLQQAGIPAYLETRVQIGPFKNKIEADAAIKKLKALGITPVLKNE
ncbi:SPOR domain-containing protein [Chitinibacter sp. GC72]|uniref:SPOR domain-containing protein n=1 Tax=Chitinibacter sp. GC72 TaxID=1526917 RepID=UPI0012FC7C6A|nr:SPOR domain-containing protein [Chitinibacter sp. GC72]